MAEQRTGKLVVILHADVAGSTALVQRDEHQAHECITAAFQSLAQIIRAYRGKVHEVRGDALVAEFSRASDAVCAALAFQQENAVHAGTHAEDMFPEMRIGISLGEVVIADHTVTGAGVVLAQRVEQLAEPGGVCITAAIHEALPPRMPFEQASLGEQAIKGFDEPVRVYAVRLRHGAQLPQADKNKRPTKSSSLQRIAIAAVVLVAVGAALLAVFGLPGGDTSRSAQQLLDKPSIAVLPFTNMSGNPEQEYFADGMTDDLITDLSKISGLFVIARNSSFAYKGQAHDLRRVAKELSVRYVLEGSVRRAGQNMRVNAQLIDAATGGHLWAERFDGSTSDVFSLQDSINRKIVSALSVKLTGKDRERLSAGRTASSDAYDALLRGLELYQRYNPADNAAAREHFVDATTLDPNYARAYANIAWSYATDVNFNWADDDEDAIARGLEYAERAAQLDDGIPQIHMTRSVLYLSQRQHDKAISSARRTLDLHPSNADAHATLAFVLVHGGAPAQALEAILAAKRLNPRYSYIYVAIEGHAHFLMAQYEQALVLYEDALERNPGFDRGHLQVAAIYAHLGKSEEAMWALEEALSIRANITLSGEEQGVKYKRPEDVARYIEGLRKAGLSD